MTAPGAGVRVCLACGVTDMRKGIAGLAAHARLAPRQNPASGAVFCQSGHAVWRARQPASYRPEDMRTRSGFLEKLPAGGRETTGAPLVRLAQFPIAVTMRREGHRHGGDVEPGPGSRRRQ